MRSLVLAATLLAGLLAVAAPPAQALCAVDEEGGCSRIRHSLDLEVSGECAEGQALCIVDKDGNLTQSMGDAEYDIVVRNPTGSAITFELFVLGGFDDDGMPQKDRRAAQSVATLEVAAGETGRLEDVVVPADFSFIRVQALSEAGTQAEQDAELMNYRILMTGIPEDGLGEEEPAGNLDDDVPADEDAEDSDAKDAPAAPFALVVAALACMVLAYAFRRDE